MKKLLSLVVILAMVCALCACGEKETTPSAAPSAEPTKEAESTAPATEAKTETSAPATETAEPTTEAVTTEDAGTTEPADTTRYLIKVDGDNDNAGELVESNEYAVLDGEFGNLYFSAMGNASTEFAEGKGVDGTNCYVVQGRASTWNGASFNITEEFYGKALKVSYDAMVDFTIDPEVTEGVISLTSKFNTVANGITDIEDPDFKASAQYPAYNRVQKEVKSGEWVHCEGMIYFPTDAFRTDLDGAYNSVIYFELGASCDDIYLDNVVIEIVDENIGTWEEMEAKKADIAAANGITLEEPAEE